MVGGRPSKERRDELRPLVLAAWRREDRPSVTAISRELGLGESGKLVRSLLREAGVEPERRMPLSAKHGGPGMWQTRGCRCEVCVEGRREYRRKHEFGRLSADEQASALEEIGGVRARLQAESAKTARRSGGRWTGPELELVARDDLTVSELAERLGRTFHAVSHVRAALRDPKHRDHMRYVCVLHGLLPPKV